MDAFNRHIDVRRELLKTCPSCKSATIKVELTSNTLDGYGLNRCESCDLIFTNPRPIAADIPLLYEDRSAGMDLGTDNSISFAMKSLKIKYYIRKLLALTDITDKFNVLDAGCGDGMIANCFASMPNCIMAAGVDFHSSAPPLFNSPKMSYRNYAQLSELGPFNIIILRHVVEHVADTNKFINSFIPLLSSGGYIFIEVPDYNSNWRKLFGAYYNQLVIPYHLYHFTPETLKSTIQRLRIEKIVSANVPVIGPSLGRLFGIRISQIGPIAAVFYPMQIVIDAMLHNHTAMLVVARAK